MKMMRSFLALCVVILTFSALSESIRLQEEKSKDNALSFLFNSLVTGNVPTFPSDWNLRELIPAWKEDGTPDHTFGMDLANAVSAHPHAKYPLVYLGESPAVKNAFQWELAGTTQMFLLAPNGKVILL